MLHKNDKIIQILLVEDDENDVEFTRLALSDGKINNELKVLEDGDVILEYLDSCKNKIPDLILLDLNLPKVSGMDVLKSIKDHSRYRSIPVIVLTSSVDTSDIKKAYDSHANCYLRKPMGHEHFAEVIHAIEKFWLNAAILPNC